MAYSILINSTDVSSYVVSVNSIPIIARNADYTLIAEGYKFELSSASPETGEVGDNVYVYSGSVLLHNGQISSNIRNYEDSTYENEVDHKFIGLKEYMIDYDTYDATFQVSASAQTCNGISYNLIGHVNLIKALLSKIGISLDTTTYYTVKTDYDWSMAWGYVSPPRAWPPTYATNRFHSGVPITNVSENEMFYLPQQLYSINQGGAWPVQAIESVASLDRQDDKINAWELLSELCSITGFVFAPKDTTTYYLINRIDFPSTIDNDKLYEYEREDFSPKATNVACSYVTLRTRVNGWEPDVGDAVNSIWWFPYGYTMEGYIRYEASGWYYYTNGQKVTWDYTGTDYPYWLIYYDGKSCCPTVNSRLNDTGKKQSISVLNHFNPIVIKTGVVYVVPMDVWYRNEYPTEHKMAAVLDGGTKFTYVTDASKLGANPEIYYTAGLLKLEIKDVRKNTLNVEYIN